MVQAARHRPGGVPRPGSAGPSLDFRRPGMAEWQTHPTQNRAGASPWEFESPSRDHAILVVDPDTGEKRLTAELVRLPARPAAVHRFRGLLMQKAALSRWVTQEERAPLWSISSMRAATFGPLPRRFVRRRSILAFTKSSVSTSHVSK